MQIIALYHIKGGVGKTSAAVNLAYLSARSGAATLICDLDPQGASSFCFRIKPKFQSGTEGFIKGGDYLEMNIKGTDYEGLDLLPADLDFRNLDIAFENRKKSRKRLGKSLSSLITGYDYVILDCPPNITLLSENIFNAADIVLIPIVPTTLSIRSYEQLKAFFIKNNYDVAKISGFFSMVERRKRLHKDIVATMQGQYPEILESAIPYLADVEKMGQNRAPVCAFAANSRAARAYENLWTELIEA